MEIKSLVILVMEEIWLKILDKYFNFPEVQVMFLRILGIFIN